LGDYPQAASLAAQYLQLARELELRALEAEALTTLGAAHLHLEQGATGLEQIRASLSLAQELGDWESERLALLNLGNGLRRLGQIAEAAAIYRETLAKAQAHAEQGGQLFALAGLVALAGAAPDQAGEQALALVSLLLRQEVDLALGPAAALYLAGYQGLAAEADERAGAVLQAGQRVVMDLAARIKSEARRRSFLENVPANRELLAACAQVFPAGVPDTPIDLAALFPTAPAEPPETETDPATPERVIEADQIVFSEQLPPAARDGDAPATLALPQPVMVLAAAVAASSLVPAALAGPLPIDLSGAGLVGAVLNVKNMAGWCLTGADLSRAQLRAADLQHADLRGASLRGADLRGADLRGANLRGTDLTEVLSDEQTLWPENFLLPPG
jgi:hypothetical protein